MNDPAPHDADWYLITDDRAMRAYLIRAPLDHPDADGSALSAAMRAALPADAFGDADVAVLAGLGLKTRRDDSKADVGHRDLPGRWVHALDGPPQEGKRLTMYPIVNAPDLAPPAPKEAPVRGPARPVWFLVNDHTAQRSYLIPWPDDLEVVLEAVLEAAPGMPAADAERFARALLGLTRERRCVISATPGYALEFDPQDVTGYNRLLGTPPIALKIVNHETGQGTALVIPSDAAIAPRVILAALVAAGVQILPPTAAALADTFFALQKVRAWTEDFPEGHERFSVQALSEPYRTDTDAEPARFPVANPEAYAPLPAHRPTRPLAAPEARQ